MKVLTIYDHSGPKYHRCWLPLYLMPGIEMTVSQVLEESMLEGVDLLFVNRIISHTTLDQVLQYREKYGFKLIVDFDDHWQLDPDHYLSRVYELHRAPELMEAYIQEADGVTVTHNRLAAEVRRLNPAVAVLPNAIPRWGQFTVKRIESPFTRLFWAGGVTHKKDLELLRGPLRRLSDDSAMMALGGYTHGNPEYAAMRSAYTNGGRLRSTIIESLPVDRYYHAYAYCDIALVPLRQTRFNSFKSNLKILEAANMGAPAIVSCVHPYLGFPTSTVTYVTDQRDWHPKISRLLRDNSYREQLGENLRAYCAEFFDFDKINQQRKQFFEYVTGKQAAAGTVPAAVPAMDQQPVTEPAAGAAGADPAGNPGRMGPGIHSDALVRSLRG